MSNFQTIGGLVDQVKYQEPARTKYDLTQATNRYVSLHLKMGTFIHNDGTESKQVILEGTVPIVYQGATYNIPVEIFIMLSHPIETPLVYVRPISTMMIKPGHTFVNADGLVSTKYVLQATGNGYTSYVLADFLHAMSEMFGREPPLFTKPKPRVYNGYTGESSGGAQSNGGASRSTNYNGAGARLQLNNPPQAQDKRSSGGNTFADSGRYHEMGARPAMKAMEERKPPVQFSDQSTSKAWTDSAKSIGSNSDSEWGSSKSLNDSGRRGSAASRSAMERMLTEKIQIALVSGFSAQREELEKAMGIEQEISDSTADIEGQFESLTALQKTLEMGLEDLQNKESELDVLVEKMAENKVPLEDRLVPYDALSAQMVKLASEKAAIEDTMYYLERALANSENPSVQVNDFVKETRKLARNEFHKRYHLNKIQKVITEAEAQAGVGKDA